MITKFAFSILNHCGRLSLICGVLFCCALVGCQTEPTEPTEPTESSRVGAEAGIDQNLVAELEEMAKVDQIAAYIPQGEHKDLSHEEWKEFKLNTFETNRQRLEEILQQHGFIGYDKAGKEGSDNFWLMTQHCDHDVDFQQRVLKAMKKEVAKRNASPANYAMLVDRVKLNLGKPQIYGTQVSYDLDVCQAFSKNLANKENVNSLRKQIGLDPIEVYLNEMSAAHFNMNRERYLGLGIAGPKLYSVDTTQ